MTVLIQSQSDNVAQGTECPTEHTLLIGYSHWIYHALIDSAMRDSKHVWMQKNCLFHCSYDDTKRIYGHSQQQIVVHELPDNYQAALSDLACAFKVDSAMPLSIPATEYDIVFLSLENVDAARDSIGLLKRLLRRMNETKSTLVMAIGERFEELEKIFCMTNLRPVSGANIVS